MNPDYLVKVPRKLNAPAQYIEASNPESELSALRAENERLEKANDKLEAELSEKDRIFMESLKVRDRLRDALEKYGMHKGYCREQPGFIGEHGACDCGFTAALRASQADHGDGQQKEKK